MNKYLFLIFVFNVILMQSCESSKGEIKLGGLSIKTVQKKDISTTIKESFITREFFSNNIRIAIPSFIEDSLNFETDFAIIIKSKIIQVLSEFSNIIICERGSDLEYVFDEMKLYFSGLFDEQDNIIETGKLLNANYIMLGNIINKSETNCDIILKFISVNKATIDQLITINLESDELKNIRRTIIRKFPSDYYDKIISKINSEILEILKKLLHKKNNYKVFLCVINKYSNKVSNTEYYVYQKIFDYLIKNKISVQENVIGPKYTFKNSLTVLEALKTKIYSKYKYYILEIEQHTFDKYIEFKISIKDDNLKSQNIYYTKTFFIENNKSITEYNRIIN